MSDMTEYGEVVKIREKTAFVKFKRSSACGRCRACGMLSNQNEIVVQMDNTLNAVAGDLVAVSIGMKKAMRASLLAYVFPLMMLVLGVFVGWLIADAWPIFENVDVMMAICGLVFVVGAFVLLKIAAPSYNKSVSSVYRMMHIKKK